jgi:hypothetical protein
MGGSKDACGHAWLLDPLGEQHALAAGPGHRGVGAVGAALLPGVMGGGGQQASLQNQSPVWLTPYSACSGVKPSYSSWSMRPERENDE